MSSICWALPASRFEPLPAGVWSIGSSVMTNQIMLHMSKFSGKPRPSSFSSRSISPFHRLMSSGESWMPIQPERPYFAMRLAERFGSFRPEK
jgi:hypothetical protein